VAVLSPEVALVLVCCRQKLRERRGGSRSREVARCLRGSGASSVRAGGIAAVCRKRTDATRRQHATAAWKRREPEGATGEREQRNVFRSVSQQQPSTNAGREGENARFVPFHACRVQFVE